VPTVLHRIFKADPHREPSVSLAWEDGTAARCDFRPMAGSVCAPSRDPDRFVGRMRVADKRSVLARSDEIEFGADSLRYRAFPEARERDDPTAAAQ
jgi:hypothetical protein